VTLTVSRIWNDKDKIKLSKKEDSNKSGGGRNSGPPESWSEPNLVRVQRGYPKTGNAQLDPLIEASVNAGKAGNSHKQGGSVDPKAGDPNKVADTKTGRMVHQRTSHSADVDPETRKPYMSGYRKTSSDPRSEKRIFSSRNQDSDPRTKRPDSSGKNQGSDPRNGRPFFASQNIPYSSNLSHGSDPRIGTISNRGVDPRTGKHIQSSYYQNTGIARAGKLSPRSKERGLDSRTGQPYSRNADPRPYSSMSNNHQSSETRMGKSHAWSSSHNHSLDSGSNRNQRQGRFPGSGARGNPAESKPRIMKYATQRRLDMTQSNPPKHHTQFHSGTLFFVLILVTN